MKKIRGERGRENNHQIAHYLASQFSCAKQKTLSWIEKSGIEKGFFFDAMECKSILTLEECLNLERESDGHYIAKNMLNIHPRCLPEVMQYLDGRCERWEKLYRDTKGDDNPVIAVSALYRKAGIMGSQIWKYRVGQKEPTIDNAGRLHVASNGFFDARKIRPDHYVCMLKRMKYKEPK